MIHQELIPVWARRRGQSEAIARSILTMASLRTPIIAVIIGEGGSGGAWLSAWETGFLMLEHTIYSFISPEGYASILWKDASRNKEAAETFGITAQDVLKLGVVEDRARARGGAPYPEATAKSLGQAISESLDELLSTDPEILIESRYNKFRAMGQAYLV